MICPAKEEGTSKMKYTPGPWLVHEWGRKYTVVEANVRVTEAPGITMAGQKILAKEITRKGDALKMAAAPELYEALKAYQLANPLHNDAEAQLFDLAQEALAKAEVSQ